jgi:hypothetical protein
VVTIAALAAMLGTAVTEGSPVGAAVVPRHVVTSRVGTPSTSVAKHSVRPNTLTPPFTVVPVDVPAQAIPVVGDFNGDGRDDILWYGPGPIFDQLMLSAPGRTFTRHSIQINGLYEPLVGDFNGDHHTDILWYGPGALPDVLWLGRGDGTFASHSITVNGVYQPIVADFNHDGRDDILWYAPGTAPDYVAYGTTSGVFSVHPVTINGSYDFVTGGDFNGDGRTDLLFWSSKATRHPLWLANAGAGFTSTSIGTPAVGAYPMVMNVDGDSKSDILWYGPGAIRDGLVLGATGYSHVYSESISGNYQPLWGNFDGDVGKRTDVLWWSIAPGGQDAYWKSTGSGLTNATFAGPHVDWSSHYATFGDFDGDGALDICFYDTSGRDTSIYYG